MAKITSETTETIIDFETGETKIQRNTKTVRLPPEPSFVKIYLDDIVKMSNLPRGQSSKVLYELIKLVNYNSEIILNSYLKKQIMEKVKIKNQKSLGNILQNLIKSNIIKRIDRGSFLLNPNLFAKGQWTDIRRLRNKYLKLNIKYKNNEREMYTEILDDKE